MPNPTRYSPSKIKKLEDPSLFPFSIQLQSNQPSIKPSPHTSSFPRKDLASSPSPYPFPNFPKNWMKERMKKRREREEEEVAM